MMYRIKLGLLLTLLIFFCLLDVQAQSPSAAASPHDQSATDTLDESERAEAVSSEGKKITERVGKSAGDTSKLVALPPEKASPVSVPRFEKYPVIDGKLDDEVWNHAAVFKGFYQFQPGDNTAPSRPTEVLMGFDSKNLYIAFHAYDEPDKVRATLAKRDSVSEDDWVGVFLDTYNDKRRAYELLFNPLGVQADAIFTEGVGDDFSVDIVMESKGILTNDGYTVEISIPFKSLRYEAGEHKMWGVHFVRTIKRNNYEQTSWMPISRDNSSFLNQAGHITGLDGITAERTLELIPSLTLSETGKRVRALTPEQRKNLGAAAFDPGRFVNQPIGLDPGLTAKYTITPTVVLALALNPDFAQVEADQTVVTANQRFPIFFEEKRPFFLEGIDIFKTPLDAVHTRAITDPDAAIKLTGKQGRNSFGILLASDNGPGAFFGDERLDPHNFRFLDKNAYIGVLRLKRDLGRESSIGFIATSYSFIERHNHLGGIDGRFRLDPQTTFAFQVLGTTSRLFFFDPELDRDIYRTGSALGYSLNYDHIGRHFNYNFNGSGRMRDYRAEVGFTPRTNTNRENIVLRYNSEPKPNAKLVSWGLFHKTGTNFDWQGRMQNWDSESQFRIKLKRETSFKVGFTLGYERLFEEEFGAKRTAILSGTFAGDDPERSSREKLFYTNGQTVPSKKFSMSYSLIYILGAFDLDFGAGPKFPRVSPAGLRDQDAPLDPGPGNELSASMNVTYQPTEALRFSLDYTKDRLRRRDTQRIAFDDDIISLRATYQFTRFTFLRAYMDYDSIQSNYRGQFLLGWTPNPGRAFYVGYNDDLNRNGFNPFTGQPESGFRRNGHTFFIKASYLFRHNTN